MTVVRILNWALTAYLIYVVIRERRRSKAWRARTDKALNDLEQLEIEGADLRSAAMSLRNSARTTYSHIADLGDLCIRYSNAVIAKDEFECASLALAINHLNGIIRQRLLADLGVDIAPEEPT